MLDQVSILVIVTTTETRNQNIDPPLIILDDIHEIKQLGAAERHEVSYNLKHSCEFVFKSINFRLWLFGCLFVLCLERNFIFLDFS